MIKCILIKLGENQFRVTNVGKPSFWPHDGDLITFNDIDYLREEKGWQVEVSEGTELASGSE